MKTIYSLESVSIDTLSNLSVYKIEKIFTEAKYHTTKYKPFCPDTPLP